MLEEIKIPNPDVYGITPSLYQAWYYYMKGYGTDEDFLKVLKKEPGKTTPAMIAGEIFELWVRLLVQGKDTKTARQMVVESDIWNKAAVMDKEDSDKVLATKNDIVSQTAYWDDCCINAAKLINVENNRIVEGSMWQVRVQRNLNLLHHGLYQLYGYADVIKRDRIFDLKYTSMYETGKFSYSIQHLVYMYCTGLKKFRYIIFDAKERDVYVEDYSFDTEALKLLMERICSFVVWLRKDHKPDYLGFFRSKWKKPI